MALAYDNSSGSDTDASALSGITLSHSCGGSNRALIVGIAGWQKSAGTGSVSGVTYGGVAMTEVGSIRTGSVLTYLFKLANPASGANNIVVTLSGTHFYTVKVQAVSYTDADQTDPVEAYNTASGYGKTASVAVTTVSADAIVHDMMHHYGTNASTVGADQTQRQQANGNSTTGATSTEPKASAGSVTMSWTWLTNNRDWSTIAAAIKPYSGGGGGNVRLINIGDTFKTVTAEKINIGDTWKDVVSIKINIGDTWKTIF